MQFRIIVFLFFAALKKKKKKFEKLEKEIVLVFHLKYFFSPEIYKCYIMLCGIQVPATKPLTFI